MSGSRWYEECIAASDRAVRLEKERDALLRINASLLKDMQTLTTINFSEDNCASLEVATRRIRAFARESIKKVGEQ